MIGMNKSWQIEHDHTSNSTTRTVNAAGYRVTVEVDQYKITAKWTQWNEQVVMTLNGIYGQQLNDVVGQCWGLQVSIWPVNAPGDRYATGIAMRDHDDPPLVDDIDLVDTLVFGGLSSNCWQNTVQHATAVTVAAHVLTHPWLRGKLRHIVANARAEWAAQYAVRELTGDETPHA